MKVEELESVSAKPTFWDDQKKAQAVLRDKRDLEKVVHSWDAQVRAISDAETLLELADEMSDEDSGKEVETSIAAIKKALEDIEFRRMLSGPLDSNGAIVAITSGAGGVDASDWAQMLLRMLMR
ncbi:MAG TPA: PCRF domain-containing protein, partial [Kofleriaceae bacterium]|nr:PCRF domain-containing protein [Kofleriaceae bacterium]